MAATRAAALNASFSSAILSPASRLCVASVVQQRIASRFGASAGQGNIGAVRAWSPTPCQASSSPFNCATGLSRCILRSSNSTRTSQRLSGNLNQPLTWNPLFLRSGHQSLRRQIRRLSQKRIKSVVSASLAGPGTVQIASSLFQLATAFVIPFYTVMILAPQWHWTQKMMESELTYFILGAGYIYLLCLSWTPETLGFMFATKYGLPELAGITRMFASTLTVASAWLHLLAVDLFAGRQVFLDGLKHNVETRHSLVLCLLMCPIGIFSHVITKSLVLLARKVRDPAKADVSDDLLSSCSEDPV